MKQNLKKGKQKTKQKKKNQGEKGGSSQQSLSDVASCDIIYTKTLFSVFLSFFFFSKSFFPLKEIELNQPETVLETGGERKTVQESDRQRLIERETE